jgi:hypothetical protein
MLMRNLCASTYWCNKSDVNLLYMNASIMLRKRFHTVILKKTLNAAIPVYPAIYLEDSYLIVLIITSYGIHKKLLNINWDFVRNALNPVGRVTV